MLTADALQSWFRRLDVPEQTRVIVNHIRSANPSRRVGGGKSNVRGRYPSRKMGVTIQFESHRVELAGIYEMEHDVGTLEYFDQPPAIKLDYASPGGKRMGVLHTPDFFVIRENEAGWEEWKTEEDLQRLSERNPNRYCAGEGVHWCCPPGVAHAERLGLYYRVRSSAEIDWVFQRNIQFLEDYLRVGSSDIPPAKRDAAVSYVLATPGLSLDDLIQVTKETVTADDIFAMIAADVLYVDWRAAPLAEPLRVEVFSTPEAASLTRRDGRPRTLLPSTIRLQCGSQITWDGRLWNVVNLGETSVGLLSEDQRLTELPVAAFEALIRENRLQVAARKSDLAADSALRDRLSRASEADLRAATYRAGVIGGYLDTGTLPTNTDVPMRTFFRWLDRYRKAEATYGSGFLGLLPQYGQRGNRTAKLPGTSRRLMQECIEQDYETLKQKTKYSSWIQLKRTCEAQAAPTPSYRTFCLAVRQRPGLAQTLKRKGRRASYQREAFYWDLDLKTPRHGDRPFEIVHIDHTELDVECVSYSGQALGRPWMTLMTDAFSRRVLAFYLTFDPPSYRSCMMVLRECVRRFGRFPQILVVDGGREFESTYFETLLARYECTKKSRPPAKARFGSTCERLFGVVNTQFIHNLRGNTQITRNVRQVTKAVDPKGLATWPLPEIHKRLLEYLYEVHDLLNHQALGQSPRETFQMGLVSGGARIHRMVAYNEEFLMLTLPTTSKGAAKVMRSKGVKINHIYYWCEAFRQIEDETVPVRYDPFDVGTAYAFVRKQWLQCYSDCYGALKGRSEREIMLATEELRRRHQNHSASFTVTARHLAEFLQSVEAEEALLAQRVRDRESREIRLGIVAGAESGGAMFIKQPPARPEHMAPTLDEATVGEMYGEF
ncbi:MAG: DDE-type integrase/transposase/recombinase [Bryobacteraceae bacterium]|nr:DDE-type integrase/transposase/recombinase [Bryobacteraceae bacterium]